MKKNIPNMITLLNLSLGVLSIYFSILRNFFVSALLILFCVVLDFIDGYLARFLKAESKLGAELDSLSDLISFGLAPFLLTLILFNLNKTLLILGIIFICCGAYRLARYNSCKKSKSFSGMPITLNGVIIPLMALLNLNKIIFTFFIVISSLLMISKIKFNRVAK